MKDKICKKTNNGWLIIYTKDLMSSNDLNKFEELLDDFDPTKNTWMALPSEYVKKVEYLPRLSLKELIKSIIFKIRWWLYCQKKKDT